MATRLHSSPTPGSFRLEDPNTVRVVGVELGVEVEEEGMRLRGIIDRLDIGPDGSLTVVDYKTGRAPSARYEQSRMGGVQTYALLCEKLLGRAPTEVRLLHLREPVVISAYPTAQTLRGQQQRTNAVWGAIERACATEDFRPKTGPLCNFCHFKSSCPAFGAA
jgi:putative RecB family exonuclease